jgi:hypothetical protein
MLDSDTQGLKSNLPFPSQSQFNGSSIPISERVPRFLIILTLDSVMSITDKVIQRTV